MKTLHLLRHAKSAWDEHGLSDRERGLNKRGERAAPRMGAALAEALEPVAVCVSPAQRAQLTLEGLCSGWPELAAMGHETVEALYTFDARDLVDWLVDGDDEQDSLFLIGHNPAFTDLINWLDEDAQLDNLPTAGYARLALDIPGWAQLEANCGSLERLLVPRQLG